MNGHLPTRPAKEAAQHETIPLTAINNLARSIAGVRASTITAAAAPSPVTAVAPLNQHSEVSMERKGQLSSGASRCRRLNTVWAEESFDVTIGYQALSIPLYPVPVPGRKPLRYSFPADSSLHCSRHTYPPN
jgi:hypothetical protein